MKHYDKVHVQDVYNKIAKHFDQTRTYQWKGMVRFLDSLSKNSLIADVGCGNGRNMIYPNHVFLGSDFSIEFAKICAKKKLEPIIANNLELPYRNNVFDATISIAVIHHLSDVEDRKNAVKELIRITRPQGRVFIQVWSYEREKGKKFQVQDNMIRWSLQNKYSNDNQDKEYFRYYHLFKKGELEKLIDINQVKIVNSYIEKNNYIVVLEKIN